MEVSASSLNKSDCFILDQGKKHDILVLMPPGAKKMEQFRANQVATQIRDEDHAGNAEVKLIGHTHSRCVTIMQLTWPPCRPELRI